MNTGNIPEGEAIGSEYMSTPESEDARYSYLYKRGYGVGPIHDLFGAGRRWGAFEGVESAIDVGCGRGMALGVLLNAGVSRVVGVDISSYAIAAVRLIEFEAYHGELRDLARMFQPGEFDLVWSCDVMEHLPEPWVDDALRGMRTVCAKNALFNISTRPSLITDRSGHNLHLTVRSGDWWCDRIARAGFVEDRREELPEEVRILARTA